MMNNGDFFIDSDEKSIADLGDDEGRITLI
jgi:hypothetical protein